MAIEVTEASFDQEVIERSRRVPVVVDFWAEWCGPCRTLTPALEAAEASRGGKVLLAKVDVDANQPLAARYRCRASRRSRAFRDGWVLVATLLLHFWMEDREIARRERGAGRATRQGVR